MPQRLNGNSNGRWDGGALRAGATSRPMRNSIPPTSFLKSEDLREDPFHQFLCEPGAIGLRPGHFPPRIATDAGNGESLSIQRPIFDAEGELFGVLYRQGDIGLEILVQIG
jgi:hypothetical protein